MPSGTSVSLTVIKEDELGGRTPRGLGSYTCRLQWIRQNSMECVDKKFPGRGMSSGGFEPPSLHELVYIGLIR